MRSRGVVTRHLAEDCDLVAPLLPGLQFLSVSMPITVTVILYRLFEVVIDVRSFQHPPEIHRHPVKNRSSLSISVDMLVANAANSRRAIHQLGNHEENKRQHSDRHE